MRWSSALIAFSLLCTLATAQNSIGIFEGHSDVGTVLHPGSTAFDSAKNTYTLTGSGENMWSTQDAFQFAWKKVSGDVEVTADVQFPNAAGNGHKKAVVIFRKSLEPGAIYADIALHGNGLLALQYREENGGVTGEVISRLSPSDPNAPPEKVLPPVRLRLMRHGSYVYMSVGAANELPHYDGESTRIPFEGDFYAGIGVCAHDKDATEQATFSNVNLQNVKAITSVPVLYSTLEIVPISSGFRQVVYGAEGRFEAPNWSRDGSYLLFNRNGHLEKLPISGGTPDVLKTGAATHLNNDHGISPDATQLAISDNTADTSPADKRPAHDSLIYVLAIGGGEPHLITQNAPSYWHGWSPDGKTLAFVGQRNSEFDIYTIPVAGGEETRLTTAKGL